MAYKIKVFYYVASHDDMMTTVQGLPKGINKIDIELET